MRQIDICIASFVCLSIGARRVRYSKRATYLEDDGLALELRPVLEDGIDDLEELVPLEDARVVLLEVLDEVVQDEVRA